MCFFRERLGRAKPKYKISKLKRRKAESFPCGINSQSAQLIYVHPLDMRSPAATHPKLTRGGHRSRPNKTRTHRFSPKPPRQPFSNFQFPEWISNCYIYLPFCNSRPRTPNGGSKFSKIDQNDEEEATKKRPLAPVDEVSSAPQPRTALVLKLSRFSYSHR